MRTKPIVLNLILAATLAGGLVSAEEPADGAGPESMTLEERQAHREAMRERWEGMSEEEREAFRREMREKGGPRHAAKRRRLENLSEEERAAMRERWQNMTEEERQAMREKMRERRAGRQGPGKSDTDGPEA